MIYPKLLIDQHEYPSESVKEVKCVIKGEMNYVKITLFRRKWNENLQNKMDMVANNIANVNTTGFKSSRVLFQDVMSQTTAKASAQVMA